MAARRQWLSRLAKVAIGALAMVPAARIGWLAWAGQLGANPIAEAMNRLGFWTLTLLLATLAPTPIQVVTGWKWPLRLRRMLGLETFLYVCLHFAVYLGVDQFFDLPAIGKDIVKRKFITVGFAAFLLLIPLALTSTDGMVRRLGFARWKRLHRLVYLVAGLGVVHFVWRVKSDLRQPLLFAAALAALLVIRVLKTWRPPHASRPARSAPATSAPRA
ncbi:MAG TPA: protein-methionine-sulfoxide reductase heme-binding subunit MsrQ [Polyangia bacterium]|nr:protein-methionine-sulfoxide reductase heme-binding subunit MsrQ [Polyangia bacterium]